jgi:hypothetical protein
MNWCHADAVSELFDKAIVEGLQGKSGDGPHNEVVGPNQAVYVATCIGVIPGRTSAKPPEECPGPVFDGKKAEAIGGGAHERGTVTQLIVGAFEERLDEGINGKHPWARSRGHGFVPSEVVDCAERALTRVAGHRIDGGTCRR